MSASSSDSAGTADLLRQFEQSFADSTLSVAESLELRSRLAAHGQQCSALSMLRQ